MESTACFQYISALLRGLVSVLSDQAVRIATESGKLWHLVDVPHYACLSSTSGIYKASNARLKVRDPPTKPVLLLFSQAHWNVIALLSFH